MAYVYRFLDSRGNVTYIGKTKRSMNERMNEHFSERGHLPKQCYDSVATIEYMKANTDADSLLIEVYLINKYRPRFNKQNKSNDIGQTIKLDIEENWKVYRSIKPIHEEKPIGCFKSLILGVGYIALLIYFVLFLLGIL